MCRRAAWRRTTASSCSAAARGRCSSTSSSRPVPSRCRPTPTCAGTSCRVHEPQPPNCINLYKWQVYKLMQFDRVSPARALAFATIRATFEEGAFTERVFRAEADRLALAGRDRAQAQRLAYGAVQRRGTSDVAIEKLAGRSTRLLDPPVLAALRLGLYELLFADATPDHAAVDQAVELVKAAVRPRRRLHQRDPAPGGARAY